MKKYLLTAAAVVIVAAAAAYSFKVCAEKNEGVAAKVNGEVISIEEIKKGYNDNPQIAAQVPFDQFYDKAVDIFINGKLMLQQMQKFKILQNIKNNSKQLKKIWLAKFILNNCLLKKLLTLKLKTFMIMNMLKTSKAKKKLKQNISYFLMKKQLKI